MSEVTPQNINSTFVVLDDANNAIPIAVGDRFYEKLEQQFGDFKGKRLIAYYTFDLMVQRRPERLAVAGVLYETGIAEKGRFMRRLSSPTQSKSHGNTPSVSSTARAIASMG